MNLGIEGKKALVTAASRGIGMAIVKSLAQEGVKVFLTSRSTKNLQTLFNEIGGEKKGHDFLTLDLTEEHAPTHLVDKILSGFGPPDIIIHNLGGNLDLTDPFCDINDWRKVFRINLEVPIELNRLLIPYMQQQKWGRVCHVSSISALENHGPPPYCAAKAALIAYTRSLARYVSHNEVIVTSVLPGAVLTKEGYWDIATHKRPDHVKKYLNERMAIKRFGKPEEISDVITFLCSEKASFCVGSAFLVDGGQGRVFFAQE